MSSGFARPLTLEDSTFVKLRDVLGPRLPLGFPGGARGKGPACKAGDARDKGSISRSGRFPAGGHAKPLQYSCLENPTEEPGGLRSIGSQRVRHD